MRIRPREDLPYPPGPRQGVSVVALACLALGISAAACVAPASGPVPSNTPAPAGPTQPEPFVGVPEMTFAVTAHPLSSGPIRGLAGLYGEYGSPVFATCRIEQNRLLCSRYPIELKTDGPQIVRVDGQIGDGAVRVDTWTPVAWDELSQRAAAQAHLDRVAPDLAAYDWSQIARPDFGESSRQYHPSQDELKGLPVKLAGYETAGERIIWRAQGPDLPSQKPLVRRFSALYVVTDPAGKRPAELFVTIEGYVEE